MACDCTEVDCSMLEGNRAAPVCTEVDCGVPRGQTVLCDYSGASCSMLGEETSDCTEVGCSMMGGNRSGLRCAGRGDSVV